MFKNYSILKIGIVLCALAFVVTFATIAAPVNAEENEGPFVTTESLVIDSDGNPDILNITVGFNEDKDDLRDDLKFESESNADYEIISKNKYEVINEDPTRIVYELDVSTYNLTEGDTFTYRLVDDVKQYTLATISVPSSIDADNSYRLDVDDRNDDTIELVTDNDTTEDDTTEDDTNDGGGGLFDGEDGTINALMVAFIFVSLLFIFSGGFSNNRRN